MQEPKARFDPEQIKDFINYLIWDRCAEHFEHAHPGSLNPELTEQIAKYVRKYGVLLGRVTLVKNITAEQLAKYHQGKAAQLQKEIDALEHAQSYIFKALDHLKYPK